MKRIVVHCLRRYLLYPCRISLLRFSKHNTRNNTIWLFHHIPKTAGTTLNSFLSNNFIVFKDYRLGWSNNISKPMNIRYFDERMCISGHFDFGHNLTFNKRYADQLVKYDKTFRVITFLRDPLELRISLFKYLRSNDQIEGEIEIEDFLLSERNFLAKAMNCNDSNYREVINSYYFIGFVEEFQDSLSKLSQLIGLEAYEVKTKNASTSELYLDNEIKKRFYTNNSLDYNIYSFAKEKFACND